MATKSVASVRLRSWMSIPVLLPIYLIGTLSAQEIQLVSDQPIEFDEANKQMIATGEAALTYGDLILRANRIVYNEETGRAEAEGTSAFPKKATGSLRNA